jgi:hypothetical protein
MAGVHCLKEVKYLRAAHFADDDAFRTHTQAVPDKIAHGYFALALEVWRTGFQPDHVWLLQLKLG